jgi:hypothetical protein
LVAIGEQGHGDSRERIGRNLKKSTKLKTKGSFMSLLT